MDKFDNPSPKNVETKPQYYTTIVHTNRKVIPLEVRKYQKICWMWTLKHDISYPKLYEHILKTQLKGYTAPDIQKFNNNINMYLNYLKEPKEDIIPAYQKTKIHSKFHEHFIPDCPCHQYYWNEQTYTSPVQSIFEALTNQNCIKYSITLQA